MLRLLRFAVVLLSACSDVAAPAAASKPVSAASAAPTHRLLLLAKSHAIVEARWAARQVVARSEAELWFADPEHPGAIRVVTTPAPLSALASDPASAVVAATTTNGRVLTYERGVLLRELEVDPRAAVDAVSPDGRWLLVSVPTSSQVKVYDTHAGKEISTIEQDGGTSVFDPTGTFLLRGGSLARVGDGAVLKSWHENDHGGIYLQIWMQHRAIVFDEKSVHLVDPVTLAIKDVPFDCKRNVQVSDFADAEHGTILRLCGDRAIFVDPVKGAVTRVKLPVLPSTPVVELRAADNGAVLLTGRAETGDAPQIELLLDPAQKRATVLDQEAIEERATTFTAATFDVRSCGRRVGPVLAKGDWCFSTRDGENWLASSHGSFAVAKGGRELLRVGARSPGELQPRYRLIGGAGLGGVLGSDAGEPSASGVRWQMGTPTDAQPVRVELPDRHCDDGAALPNGHVLAVCFADAEPGTKKGKRTRTVTKLVELSPTREVLAERVVDSADQYVVVANGHPVTWSPGRGWPMVATEYAGPPSTCGERCAAVATYAVHRDFAVRLGNDQKVQIAGTLDPSALACIDPSGIVHPYDACKDEVRAADGLVDAMAP